MAAALELPSTVCWITTNPDVLGYEIHENIKANPYELHTDMNCYSGYNLQEPLDNIPYTKTENIFNIKDL